MKVEEFEGLSDGELKAKANTALQHAGDLLPHLKAGPLMEAQLYMRELEYRHEKEIHELERKYDNRISLRDLILEIVVIILIGGEILLTVKQGRDEDRLMDKQNAVLDNLKDSSKSTANTLQTLESTTETMNKAIQAQLEAANLVSLDASASPFTELHFFNRGHTNLLIYGIKEGERKVDPLDEPLFIPAGGEKGWPVVPFVDLVEFMRTRARYRRPLEVYVERDDGTQYVMKANEVGTRDEKSNAISVMIDSVTLRKSKWRK